MELLLLSSWEVEEKSSFSNAFSILDITSLLQKVKKELVSEYADRLEKISVFGSYARAEADRYSDIDLMIFLRESSSFFEDEQQISHILIRLGLSYDKILSPLVRTVSFFEEKVLKSSFYQSINLEGITIWKK